MVTTRQQVSKLFQDAGETGIATIASQLFPVFEEARRTGPSRWIGGVQAFTTQHCPNTFGRPVWVRQEVRLNNIYHEQIRAKCNPKLA